jgi:hypothetical protein
MRMVIFKLRKFHPVCLVVFVYLRCLFINTSYNAGVNFVWCEFVLSNENNIGKRTVNCSIPLMPLVYQQSLDISLLVGFTNARVFWKAIH